MKIFEIGDNDKFDKMLRKIQAGVGARSNIDNIVGRSEKEAELDIAAGRTEQDSDKKLMAKFGIDVLSALKDFCQKRVGPNRTLKDKKDAYPYLLKMYSNSIGHDLEPDEGWPEDVDEIVGNTEIGDWMANFLGISTKDLVDFETALGAEMPITEFFIAWLDNNFDDAYVDPWKEYVKDVLNLKESIINEISSETLGRYKTAAGKQATAADIAGDTAKANKRFRGIVKATKKQFDNDLKKKVKEERLPLPAPKSALNMKNALVSVNQSLTNASIETEPYNSAEFRLSQIDEAIRKLNYIRKLLLVDVTLNKASGKIREEVSSKLKIEIPTGLKDKTYKELYTLGLPVIDSEQPNNNKHIIVVDNKFQTDIEKLEFILSNRLKNDYVKVYPA